MRGDPEIDSLSGSLGGLSRTDTLKQDDDHTGTIEKVLPMIIPRIVLGTLLYNHFKHICNILEELRCF